MSGGLAVLFWQGTLPLTLLGGLASLLLWAAENVTALNRRGGCLACWVCVLMFYLAPLNAFFAAWPQEGAPAAQLTVLPAAGAAGGVLQEVSGGLLRVGVLSSWGRALRWLPLLWLMGALARGGLAVVRARSLAKRLVRSRTPAPPQLLGAYQKVCGGGYAAGAKVYILPGRLTPFTHGLLRPAVYLPEQPLQPAELDWVLRHEARHIAGRHLWMKAVAGAVAVLHWFNPLAWLLCAQLDAACELSCDAALCTGREPQCRREYAALLLKLSGPKSPPAQSGLSRAGRQLEIRLRALKRGPSNQGRKLWAGALVVLLLTACLPVAAMCESSVRQVAGATRLLQSALARSEQFLPGAADRKGSLALPEQMIRLEWPVVNYRYYNLGPGARYKGLSIVAAEGTPIAAAADGVVLAATLDDLAIPSAYGNTIVLVHSVSPDISTCYTHCAELFVQPGDPVKAGQVIGTVGATGAASGTLCRFQVRIGGELYAPKAWFEEQPLEGPGLA